MSTVLESNLIVHLRIKKHCYADYSTGLDLIRTKQKETSDIFDGSVLFYLWKFDSTLQLLFVLFHYFSLLDASMHGDNNISN